MAMGVGGKGGVKAEINVSPLVDVVLVLLIIFMVITPLVQLGYDLQIPKKVDTPPTDLPVDQIILTIVPDAASLKILINKETVPEDQLGTRLEAIYKGKPDKTMFLAADRRVNYGDVMRIVDIARKAGGDLLKIGLVTDGKIAAAAGT